MVCKLCGKSINGRNGTRCMACTTKLRRHCNKRDAVQLLGRYCVKCNYDGLNNEPAMHFHHKDPATKQFDLSRAMNKSWNVLMPELLKCALVCGNCHALLHAPKSEAWQNAVDGYQRKQNNRGPLT